MHDVGNDNKRVSHCWMVHVPTKNDEADLKELYRECFARAVSTTWITLHSTSFFSAAFLGEPLRRAVFISMDFSGIAKVKDFTCTNFLDTVIEVVAFLQIRPQGE